MSNFGSAVDTVAAESAGDGCYLSGTVALGILVVHAPSFRGHVAAFAWPVFFSKMPRLVACSELQKDQTSWSRATLDS